MSTVRIYKVAELLGATSQDVMELLRQNHGIEVKSASSTIEEVVARQFVERLARQRGVGLPSASQMFVETGAPKAKKAARQPEPPPAAPKLGPPRLVKTAKPAAPAEEVDTEAPDAAPPSAEAETVTAEPVAERPGPRLVKRREPTLRIEEPGGQVEPRELPAEVTAERGKPARPRPAEGAERHVPAAERSATPPAAAPAAAPPSGPPSGRSQPPSPAGPEPTETGVPAAAEPHVPPGPGQAGPGQAGPGQTGADQGGTAERDRAAASRTTATPEPGAKVARPTAPTPATGAQKPAPPAPPRRPVVPPPTGRVVPPSIRLRVEDPSAQPRPSHAPAGRHAPTAPAGARATRPPTSTRPLPGGPRPLPSQPIRSPLAPGARPSYQPTARPAPSPPPRPSAPYGRPRPGGRGRRHSRQGPRPPAPQAPAVLPPITRTITLAEGMTVKDLADKLDAKVKDVLKRLLEKRIVMTINTTLDTATASTIAREFGAEVKMQTFEEEILLADVEQARPEDLVTRGPVVTVMGHVDHGKTTLLDAIRETRVAAREAGGITQHIGAYHVPINDRQVVFLDTPGHEAFTMMRARGAKVTDVVVLVVAADDGVMPQTREAIDHARAANVPILVAVNKVDKPDANPDRVKRELADLGLMPEEWGGQTVMVPVSAKNRENLDLLLEMILLVADLLDLKANPTRTASGTVLEAKLDRGRGPVATVLVQEGTLRVGDTVIAGTVVGKVRALINDRGRPTKEAGPATPVEVLGLGDVPQPGDTLQQVADAAKARQITIYRQQIARQKALETRARRVTLETLQQRIEQGEVKELALIIKADVQGSAEVLAETLTKLGDERVTVRVMHTGVGAINRSDVQLASASDAIVIGFNVRPDRAAVEEAERTGVDVRLHSVIYNVTDEIKKAMAGLLEPTYREVRLGAAAVRQLFRVPKVGTVAGCIVTDGRIVRSAEARLLRDNVVVYEGKLGSLKRFKDDVSEVKSGLECGISFERFNDLKDGDVIEVFTVEQVAATV